MRKEIFIFTFVLSIAMMYPAIASIIFELHGQKIEFDPPENFIAVSSAWPEYYEYLEKITAPTQIFLDAFVKKDELQIIKTSNEFYYLDIYFGIYGFTKITQKVNIHEFQSFKRYIKKEIYPNLSKVDMNKFNELNREHKKFFSEDELQYGQMNSIGITEDEEDHLTILNLMKIKISRNGKTETKIQFISMSFFNVHGYIFLINIYKNYNSSKDYDLLENFTQKIFKQVKRMEVLD